MVDFFFFFNVL
jgi:hypothetical protein